MELEYVPLLARQRELYAIPRGSRRFTEYLRTLTDARTGDLKLPLVAMNPMGKDHLPVFLDRLQELDADGVGARSVEEARPALGAAPGSFRVCLVVSDDLHGGWTDRAASEFSHRFETRALDRRGWLTGLLWTSEESTPERVRHEIRSVLWRAAWVGEHGAARTLEEMLRQEAWVARGAGVPPPLGAEEREALGRIIEPLLARDDRPTVIAALFGDEAAERLGHPALGLRAGAALGWGTERFSARA